MNFSLKTVSERQVEKAIKAMKNKSSSGIDFISPKLIKMAVDVIKGPLCIIINTSISEREFPDSWKIGKITPMWKKKASKLSFKIARQQAFQARKEAAAAANTPSTTSVAQPKASLKTRLQPGVAQFCSFNSFLTKFKCFYY